MLNPWNKGRGCLQPAPHFHLPWPASCLVRLESHVSSLFRTKFADEPEIQVTDVKPAVYLVLMPFWHTYGIAHAAWEPNLGALRRRNFLFSTFYRWERPCCSSFSSHDVAPNCIAGNGMTKQARTPWRFRLFCTSMVYDYHCRLFRHHLNQRETNWGQHSS